VWYSPQTKFDWNAAPALNASTAAGV
jgi:hypothetical protein